MDRDSILEGLNEGQRAAAAAVDGAYLVVAGAGSGKTTVLSRRVAALIANGIDPASILLLTFTRAAARNMLDRAKKLSPAAIDVTGGTFHSVAHRLVVENHSLFRLPEKPSILDPDDVKSAFRKIVSAKAGKDENMPTPGAVAKVHSFAVNTRRETDDVVYDILPQYGHAIDFFVDCAKEYTTYKKERGLLDYDDLLVAWDRMLDHPRVAEAIRGRFRYALVDEYQDCNAIQNSIVFKLGGSDPNVMAVGDPAQSIYAFRGSAPRVMFDFAKHWPQANVVNLEVNYRSTEQILGLANAVDRSMYERFERELRPAPGASGPDPVLVTVPTLDDEASYIADQILSKKADGVELSEQAVLVRSMSHVRHIEAELVRRRIPYKVSGGIKINEAAHVKDILCLARTVVNVLDEPAWVRVLTMAKGVGDRKAADIYKKIAHGGGMLPDPVAALKGFSQRHAELGSILQAYQALAAGGPPVELLDRAVSLLDGILSERYRDDWKTRKPDIAAVVGLAGGHESLEDFLASVTLDYSVDKTSEVLGAEDEELPLTVSTVHSAKGLEWDVVYLPSFIEGHFPSIYAREMENVEEEKRVLYVAVTRPRRRLVIVKPTLSRQGPQVQESRFERLIDDHLARERIGPSRRPASFALSYDDAEIDIFG